MAAMEGSQLVDHDRGRDAGHGHDCLAGMSDGRETIMEMTAARMRALYDTVRAPWGGFTLDTATGDPVTPATGYAVAVTDTLSIAEDASYAQFVSALDQAMAEYGHLPYVGVFHDDTRHAVEFDGVVIVPDKAGVDALYAAGYPVAGGAYDFATGDGYWPAGTPAQYA